MPGSNSSILKTLNGFCSVIDKLLLNSQTGAVKLTKYEKNDSLFSSKKKACNQAGLVIY
jgi:hypothetical protein